MRRTGRAVLGLVVGVVLLPLAACGAGSDSAGGVPEVHWYIGNESWLPTVIKTCNAQANGAYRITAESLPTNPDGQREQLVRRLAAKDSSIDLIGMDEFEYDFLVEVKPEGLWLTFGVT